MKLRVGTALIAAAILAACSGTAKKDPDEPSISEIYMRKGIQYMENGMLDVALQDLKHSVELDPKNGRAHDALAVLYQRLGQPADADAEFQKALELSSSDFGIANNYGRFLCEQGQYDKAMAQFQKTITAKLYPSPWVPLTNAGLCARSTGRSAEAEGYLRDALKANPEFAPALMEMAKLSLQTSQFMNARAFIQRLESAAPPSAETLLLGIQVEQALGNEEGAQEYRAKLRAQFPDDRDAPPAPQPQTFTGRRR
ncbi:MAG: type IV pilus biogenesis/stability protein PilW [Methylococcaceae bacterium]|nr:type IV pilus biogenesis/stability protein PilW [Methylococcaceae bacterium]